MQSRADALLRQAQADDDERRAASRARLQNASTAQPDPHLDSQLHQRETDARGRVDTAGSTLSDLEDEWNAAGNRAAGAIEDVTSADGLDDSWWDDVLDVVSAVTDIAGKLSAVFGVISLICSFVPFLQPLAAVFGALALITGVISLAGHLLLYANGRASLGDVLWDVVGVVSFGAGPGVLAGRQGGGHGRARAGQAGADHLAAGGRRHGPAGEPASPARAASPAAGGWPSSSPRGRAGPAASWPTRAEWVEAYAGPRRSSGRSPRAGRRRCRAAPRRCRRCPRAAPVAGGRPYRHRLGGRGQCRRRQGPEGLGARGTAQLAGPAQPLTRALVLLAGDVPVAVAGQVRAETRGRARRRPGHRGWADDICSSTLPVAGYTRSTVT